MYTADLSVEYLRPPSKACSLLPDECCDGSKSLSSLLDILETLDNDLRFSPVIGAALGFFGFATTGGDGLCFLLSSTLRSEPVLRYVRFAISSDGFVITKSSANIHSTTLVNTFH